MMQQFSCNFFFKNPNIRKSRTWTQSQRVLEPEVPCVFHTGSCVLWEVRKHKMYHPSTTFVTMNSFLHKLPCVHVIYLQYGRVHDTGNKIKYKNIYIKTAIEFEFREICPSPEFLSDMDLIWLKNHRNTTWRHNGDIE